MYKTKRADKFFYNAFSIVGRELNFSSTVTFSHLIHLTAVEKVRAAAPSSQRPTYTAFVAKAVAMAIKDYPYANRRFYRPLGFLPLRFQIFDTIDIAVASEANEPGIDHTSFIDVIRSVEQKSLTEIANWLKTLRTDPETNPQWRTYKALITRWPRLMTKWLIALPGYFPSLWAKYRGGSVVISSPAKYGVDSVVASWTAPVGISFGLVKDRALVIDGRLVAAPSFYLVMNFDRRLMAGAQAARFFNRLVQILERAEVNL